MYRRNRKKIPRHVRAKFKQLKAGIITWDDLSDEEIKELCKYYGWLLGC